MEAGGYCLALFPLPIAEGASVFSVQQMPEEMRQPYTKEKPMGRKQKTELRGQHLSSLWFCFL